MNPEIFFSYIIPTIGRASLETAVKSVLDQEFSHAEFEVVVVNDSGNPLPHADWLASPRVSIINTNKSERSFARNSGAAIAKGKYLAFLDDDDWILPGALESFWNLANQHPNAVWLYGGIRIVDEHINTLAEINSGLNGNCFAQIMGGAWAPIQSSLIQARAFSRSAVSALSSAARRMKTCVAAPRITAISPTRRKWSPVFSADKPGTPPPITCALPKM
jgi:hypothetical protein